ncbi:hypothetical protein K431DRAFT_294323 [Polychaeton citri CBS 116435]|uniref:Uncharacterized protein n=1 Tax=Polychaeton citri CBS 116435 TaxID=1314669 RepID=A0A9P4Q6I3_9PEZI|nr:hypothetical protein K431DRAFT_294323 [Polychaeton citri CBS 116435]
MSSRAIHFPGWVLGFFYWDESGEVNTRFANGLVNSGRPSTLELVQDDPIEDRLELAHDATQNAEDTGVQGHDRHGREIEDGTNTGFLSSIVQRLGCAGKRHLIAKKKPVDHETGRRAKWSYSSIQPTSGWFAFGPSETYEPITKEE